MRVLITTDVLQTGGAETFVLRLAEALCNDGHKVVLCPLYANKIDRNLVKVIAPKVTIHPSGIRFVELWRIIDGLLRRLNIDLSFIQFYQYKGLLKRVKIEQVDIIHSHLFTSDLIAVQCGRKMKIPVFTTLHGDYNNYYNRLEHGEKVPILNFKTKLGNVISCLSGIAYISESQRSLLELLAPNSKFPFKKIYNGYSIANTHNEISRSKLGIPIGAFVFGMVARGIPDKGWDVAIQSFLALDAKNIFLLLVGDSDFVQGLKEVYASHANILFVGYSPNPIEYITIFDGCLFASTFASESLPTVIIEYLACSKPIITGDVAECAAMLKTDEGLAGIVVPVINNKISVARFSNEMDRLRNDPALCQTLSVLASIAFQKFNMKACVNSYLNLYMQGVQNG